MFASLYHGCDTKCYLQHEYSSYAEVAYIYTTNITYIEKEPVHEVFWVEIVLATHDTNIHNIRVKSYSKTQQTFAL